MNGEECEVRLPPATSPKFSYTTSIELSDSEKMDLVAGNQTPFANAIYKLMELEIIKARNKAMEADPANQRVQLSLMTIAHAIDKFYKDIRNSVEFAIGEHVLDVRQKVRAEELKDQQVFEEIVLRNARGEI